MKKKQKATEVADAGALDAPSVLKLESLCTLRESIALKASLLEQLELGRDVALDGSVIERIDAAGLQLLVAFVRQVQFGGHQVSWLGESPELRRIAAQLDLLDHIGLPAEAVLS